VGGSSGHQRTLKRNGWRKVAREGARKTSLRIRTREEESILPGQRVMQNKEESPRGGKDEKFRRNSKWGEIRSERIGIGKEMESSKTEKRNGEKTPKAGKLDRRKP